MASSKAASDDNNPRNAATLYSTKITQTDLVKAHSNQSDHSSSADNNSFRQRFLMDASNNTVTTNSDFNNSSSASSIRYHHQQYQQYLATTNRPNRPAVLDTTRHSSDSMLSVSNNSRMSSSFGTDDECSSSNNDSGYLHTNNLNFQLQQYAPTTYNQRKVVQAPPPKNTTYNNNHSDDDSEDADNLVCNACGFESVFVSGGLLSCPHCKQVCYCSSHCLGWDWKNGGHSKVCTGQKLQLIKETDSVQEKQEDGDSLLSNTNGECKSDGSLDLWSRDTNEQRNISKEEAPTIVLSQVKKIEEDKGISIAALSNRSTDSDASLGEQRQSNSSSVKKLADVNYDPKSATSVIISNEQDLVDKNSTSGATSKSVSSSISEIRDVFEHPTDAVVCKSCGFEAELIEDGMIPCPHCKQAFYCSTECMDWDWKTGDHGKRCPSVIQQHQDHAKGKQEHPKGVMRKQLSLKFLSASSRHLLESLSGNSGADESTSHDNSTLSSLDVSMVVDILSQDSILQLRTDAKRPRSSSEEKENDKTHKSSVAPTCFDNISTFGPTVSSSSNEEEKIKSEAIKYTNNHVSFLNCGDVDDEVLVCKSCGFESSLIEEAMIPSPNGDPFFYCSKECLDWDLKRGDQSGLRSTQQITKAKKNHTSTDKLSSHLTPFNTRISQRDDIMDDKSLRSMDVSAVFDSESDIYGGRCDELKQRSAPEKESGDLIQKPTEQNLVKPGIKHHNLDQLSLTGKKHCDESYRDEECLGSIELNRALDKEKNKSMLALSNRDKKYSVDTSDIKTVTTTAPSEGKELKCEACEFEECFVEDGMLACVLCESVFYCSTECRDWDWNNGGHSSYCDRTVACKAKRQEAISSDELKTQNLLDTSATTIGDMSSNIRQNPQAMILKDSAISAEITPTLSEWSKQQSYEDKQKAVRQYFSQMATIPLPLKSSEDDELSVSMGELHDEESAQLKSIKEEDTECSDDPVTVGSWRSKMPFLAGEDISVTASQCIAIACENDILASSTLFSQSHTTVPTSNKNDHKKDCSALGKLEDQQLHSMTFEYAHSDVLFNSSGFSMAASANGSKSGATLEYSDSVVEGSGTDTDVNESDKEKTKNKHSDSLLNVGESGRLFGRPQHGALNIGKEKKSASSVLQKQRDYHFDRYPQTRLYGSPTGKRLDVKNTCSIHETNDMLLSGRQTRSLSMPRTSGTKKSSAHRPLHFSTDDTSSSSGATVEIYNAFDAVGDGTEIFGESMSSVTFRSADLIDSKRRWSLKDFEETEEDEVVECVFADGKEIESTRNSLVPRGDINDSGPDDAAEPAIALVNSIQLVGKMDTNFEAIKESFKDAMKVIQDTFGEEAADILFSQLAGSVKNESSQNEPENDVCKHAEKLDEDGLQSEEPLTLKIAENHEVVGKNNWKEVTLLSSNTPGHFNERSDLKSRRDEPSLEHVADSGRIHSASDESQVCTSLSGSEGQVTMPLALQSSNENCPNEDPCLVLQQKSETSSLPRYLQYRSTLSAKEKTRQPVNAETFRQRSNNIGRSQTAGAQSLPGMIVQHEISSSEGYVERRPHSRYADYRFSLQNRQADGLARTDADQFKKSNQAKCSRNLNVTEVTKESAKIDTGLADLTFPEKSVDLVAQAEVENGSVLFTNSRVISSIVKTAGTSRTEATDDSSLPEKAPSSSHVDTGNVGTKVNDSNGHSLREEVLPTSKDYLTSDSSEMISQSVVDASIIECAPCDECDSRDIANNSLNSLNSSSHTRDELDENTSIETSRIECAPSDECDECDSRGIANNSLNSLNSSSHARDELDENTSIVTSRIDCAPCDECDSHDLTQNSLNCFDSSSHAREELDENTSIARDSGPGTLANNGASLSQGTTTFDSESEKRGDVVCPIGNDFIYNKDDDSTGLQSKQSSANANAVEGVNEDLLADTGFLTPCCSPSTHAANIGCTEVAINEHENQINRMDSSEDAPFDEINISVHLQNDVDSNALALGNENRNTSPDISVDSNPSQNQHLPTNSGTGGSLEKLENAEQSLTRPSLYNNQASNQNPDLPLDPEDAERARLYLLKLKLKYLVLILLLIALPIAIAFGVMANKPDESLPPPTLLRTRAPTNEYTRFPMASPSENVPSSLPPDATTSPNVSPSEPQAPAAPPIPPNSAQIFRILARASFDGGISIRTLDSPQNMAFRWLVADPTVSNMSDARIIQRFSMATLYYSTVGSSWVNQSRWLSEFDECTWYSSSANNAVCNNDGFLEVLDLGFNDLTGLLPPEIGMLGNLTQIVLPSSTVQTIGGIIPSELGVLSNIEVFNLNGNTIFGRIPSEVGRWSKLLYMDLSVNKLSGSMPIDLGNCTVLRVLNLSSNRITGLIPETIDQIQNLTEVVLEDNQLTGELPPGLYSLANLKVLNLKRNSLSTFSSQLTLLGALETLIMSENDFGGTLPSELGNMDSLRQMDFSTNNFRGPIPSDIGNLSNLLQLNLSRNILNGTLPTEIGNLINLNVLALNVNRLEGQLPTELGRLQALSSILIEENNFTGTVPDEICSTFANSLPLFVLDCGTANGNAQITCPDATCCTYCCSDGVGCECEYKGTGLEFLCLDLP